MAVTFNAAGASKNVASGNITTLALPAAFAADDIHVCCVAASDNVTVTFPAGWTKKLELNAGTFLRLTVGWRRAVAGDTTITVTHAAGNSAIARIFGYRGCVTTGDPFEDAQLQANTATLTITTPDLTLAQAGDMLLFVAGVAFSANTSGTYSVAGYSGTDPAFTERQDSGGGLGSNFIEMAVADGVRTAASNPGARTATISAGAPFTAAGTNNIGALLALIDASAAPATSIPLLVMAPPIPT